MDATMTDMAQTWELYYCTTEKLIETQGWKFYNSFTRRERKDF